MIDFGQAVDIRDPSAQKLSERDVQPIKDFFTSKQIKTLGLSMAMEFVMAPENNNNNTNEPELRRKQSLDAM